MPRIRTIKPDAFRSLTLARVPIEARWLFAGIWTECDDSGRMRDHAGLIRAALFPLDELPVETVEGWLTALEAEGAICRYLSVGERFLHVPGWEHQRINRPTPTVLPECPLHRGVPEQAQLPMLTPVPAALGVVDPRRCAQHQSGPPTRCGACKEARTSYEDGLRAVPTAQGAPTECPQHKGHPARNCPVCAAAATTPQPGWRPTRKATS